MKEVKRLRFGLGFQVETDKGPVDLYSVNADEDVSGTYVQSIDYDELLIERNELAAHAERLKCVALAYYTNGVCVQDVKNILAETAAQSLEAVKREIAILTLEDYDAALSSFEMTVPEYIKARLS